MCFPPLEANLTAICTTPTESVAENDGMLGNGIHDVTFCSLLRQSDDEEASPSANLKACVII